MHSWGDSWEHWPELYKAQTYFCNLYERVTGLRPYTKEKYGTIRYEHVFGWVIDTTQSQIFRECIRRTCKKFPAVAAEICADAGHVLYDEYFEGWCNGVCFAKEGIMWTSNKRPNGV